MRLSVIKKLYLFILLFAINASLIADNLGTLTVLTDPIGVEVWLGNRFLGNSPLKSIPLPTGSYKLRLISTLYHTSVNENIEISREGETLVEKKILANFGSIKLTSIPSDAKITISSTLGKTPLETEMMNPGRYTVIVTPQNSDSKFYQSDTLDLKVEPGKITSDSIVLKKQKILTRKFMFRGVLGAAAIGSFVWAIIENGKAHDFENYAKIYSENGEPQKAADANDNAKKARIFRNIGVVAGSLSVVGFEIVAFF